jgi:hypothetical protein
MECRLIVADSLRKLPYRGESMARRKAGHVFTEAAGKTVASIEYAENLDWHALVVTFTDGKVFSFEFSARVAIRANYLEKRMGNFKIMRKYGQIAGDQR